LCQVNAVAEDLVYQQIEIKTPGRDWILQVTWAFLLFFHWVMATLTAIVAHRKGRSGIGFFFYGLLVWPFALVHAFVALPNVQVLRQRAEEAGLVECPYCVEYIKPSAKVCSFCHRELKEFPHDAHSQMGVDTRVTERSRFIDNTTKMRESDRPKRNGSRCTAKKMKRAFSDGSISSNEFKAWINKLLEHVTDHTSRSIVVALIVFCIGVVALAALWDRTERIQRRPLGDFARSNTEPRSKIMPQEPATFSREAICKFGIAARMGRDPSIIVVDEIRDGVVFLSYTRPDDGTHWAYKCRLEGDKIIWGLKGGRWRTRPMDSTIIYVIRSDTIQVEDHYTDGVYKRMFNIEQLR